MLHGFNPLLRVIKMSSVFHYTDSAGLLGILSSKSLFATHYRYLNDVSEGSLIRDLILPILEVEITEIYSKLRERGLLRGFYEFHGDMIGKSGEVPLNNSIYGTIKPSFDRNFISFIRRVAPGAIMS